MKMLEEKAERFEFASLPPVSDLEDKKQRQRVIALLETLDQVVAKRQEMEEAEEKCKQELEQLQRASQRAGFRYGWLCYTAQDCKGRAGFDAERAKWLLLEHGVPQMEINSLSKEGKPYVRRTFKRLPEE